MIVSNHGGRQLDCLPSSLELLSEIVHAVGDRVAVLIDGGFRRGRNIVKALALGARACLIGRPWLFGLAADGQRGIEGVLTHLRTEMDRTLALVGCPQAGELSEQFVRFPPEWIRDSDLAGRSKEPGSSGFDK
ncbi:alpha-hydroxy-acid oxidizing protein [Streptomyces chartreusis]|uniref:alpha-hydroxy-acid oxidizing protein n=1 Tax=Streptomyces chartreusis TaxID=1969 RepID=UPI0036359468